MRGDVGARLVGDLAEVAERELVEPVGLVVDVEGAPAAAARLHSGRPGEAAVDGVAAGGSGAGRARRRRCRPRPGRGRSRTRRPSRRARARACAPPSRRHGDLLVESQSAARTSAGCSGRAPESRSASTARPVSQTGDWHASGRSRSPSSIVNPSQPSTAAAQGLVLEAVAERGQHQDRPDPRRLDPAPRAVGLLVRRTQRSASCSARAAQRARRQRALASCRARADLAEVDRRVAHRPQRLQAASGTNVAAPSRRSRRSRTAPLGGSSTSSTGIGVHPLPRPLAEQGEEALGEDPRLRDPAARADELARLLAGVDAGELQRRVGLDRRREVAAALRTRSTRCRRRAAARAARWRSCGRARACAGRGRGARRGAARSSSRSTRARRPSSRPRAGARAGARGALDRGVEARLCRRRHAATSLRAGQGPRGGEAAADRAFHRRRPARRGPRARARDVRPARPRAGRCASLPGRTAIVAAGSRLTRDQSSSAGAEPAGQLRRRSARRARGRAAPSARARRRRRPSGTGLARAAAGQRAPVEDPVRGAAEQRGQRRAEQHAVEPAGGR